MNQRGFILPSPVILYSMLGMGIVILLLGIAVKVQTVRLDSAKLETKEVKLEYAGFVADTKRLGDEALKDAAIKTALGKTKQEKANEENIRTIAALHAALRGLRDANPSIGSVPPAPAGSSRPDLAAFDRTLYQRAYREFVEEVRKLGLECSEAIVNLNTAREWARP